MAAAWQGTLEYASPEVLSAHLDPKGAFAAAARMPPVDIFSLGMTLFLMLGVRARPHRTRRVLTSSSQAGVRPWRQGRGDAWLSLVMLPHVFQRELLSILFFKPFSI